MSDADLVALFEGAGELILRYGVNVGGAILLLIVGWIAAGWAERGMRRLLGRYPRIDATIKPLVARLVRYAVLVLVLIAVLDRFGVETTSIVALVGAAGLAIGLAMQGTLSNIAASVMLLFLRPFHVGDYIDAEGIAGTVDEIDLFTSTLRTFDGIYVSVPNSQLWNRTIKNYTRLPTRRVDIPIGVAYDTDLDRAMAELKAVLDGDERVLAAPAAEVMITALGDSAVTVNMRCWVHRDHYWQFLFDITKAGKQRLDAAGIVIPFPQRDVHLYGANAAKAAGATS